MSLSLLLWFHLLNVYFELGWDEFWVIFLLTLAATRPGTISSNDTRLL